MAASPSARKILSKPLFRNVFPWKNLNEFTQTLQQNIVYRSEDKFSLIAIHKPYGVGTYTAVDKNVTKQNQDRLLCRVDGSPRYSIADALPLLDERLECPDKLGIVKSLDRYMSGLILLSDDPQRMNEKINECISNACSAQSPPYGMRAITCGYPLIKGGFISEKVGLKLIEVDELGDHKEPVIVSDPSNNMRKRLRPNETVMRVDMRMLSTNKEISSAFLELFTTTLKWDAPRCYISSKTSFILGDVRFSRRIKTLLGKPVQSNVLNLSRLDSGYDNYEPLTSVMGAKLGVSRNASIPLMLDMFALRLKSFKKRQDLIIQSPFMPKHMWDTLECLELAPEKKPIDSNLTSNKTQH